MSTSQIDNNLHNTREISFSAKRSQLQARLVCGIFDYNHKKMRVNAEPSNSPNTNIFNFSADSSLTNSDNIQLHRGLVAAGSLGAHEAPKLNSMQQGPNEADSHETSSSTGPKGKVTTLTQRDDTGHLQGTTCARIDICKSIDIRKPQNRHLHHQGSTKRARQTSPGSVPFGEPGHVCPLAKLTNGDTATHKCYINSTPFRSDTGGDLSLASHSSGFGRVASNKFSDS